MHRHDCENLVRVVNWFIGDAPVDSETVDIGSIQVTGKLDSLFLSKCFEK